MKLIGKYLWNLLIAIDQLVNTIFGDDPDETISSRLGKDRDKSPTARFFARIVDRLFFWQKNHTRRSVEIDEGRDAM